MLRPAWQSAVRPPEFPIADMRATGVLAKVVLRPIDTRPHIARVAAVRLPSAATPLAVSQLPARPLPAVVKLPPLAGPNIRHTGVGVPSAEEAAVASQSAPPTARQTPAEAMAPKTRVWTQQDAARPVLRLDTGLKGNAVVRNKEKRASAADKVRVARPTPAPEFSRPAGPTSAVLE